MPLVSIRFSGVLLYHSLLVRNRYIPEVWDTLAYGTDISPDPRSPWSWDPGGILRNNCFSNDSSRCPSSNQPTLLDKLQKRNIKGLVWLVNRLILANQVGFFNCIVTLIGWPGDSDQSGFTLQLFPWFWPIRFYVAIVSMILANQVLRCNCFHDSGQSDWRYSCFH